MMPRRIYTTWNLLLCALESISAKLKHVNNTKFQSGCGHDVAARFLMARTTTIKTRILWAASFALGAVLASSNFTPVLQAQSPSQAPNAQQDQQKTQTFVGKIVKAKNGQYALLTDAQAGKGVYLDDQDKAKQFEGKNVKVTGTLEVAKSLVHVTNIELA